jgi:hypothetical protein
VLSLHLARSAAITLGGLLCHVSIPFRLTITAREDDVEVIYSGVHQARRLVGEYLVVAKSGLAALEARVPESTPRIIERMIVLMDQTKSGVESQPYNVRAIRLL